MDVDKKEQSFVYVGAHFCRPVGSGYPGRGGNAGMNHVAQSIDNRLAVGFEEFSIDLRKGVFDLLSLCCELD